MAKITRIATTSDGKQHSYGITADHFAIAATHAVVEASGRANFFLAEAPAVAFAAMRGGLLATVADKPVVAAPRFAKGERVSFATDQRKPDGERTFGVVEGQRGDRVTVAVTPTMGMRVPVEHLRREAAVALPSAGLMSAYAVKGYKRAAFASQETDCFQCTITRDGKPVAVMANEGHGGPDMVDCGRAGTGATRDRFMADAKAWLDEIGLGVVKYTDPASMWLDWERNHRTVGVTGEAFAAYWRKVVGSPVA